mmetsp:Transcript_111408/g.309700  ORF Transcript_111408/g.309700 Transcript_111408/m.309700 type:complete len:421 (+) Transcript_111408:71-1333(+)
MATTGENLIARVRRIRDVDNLQHDAVPNVAEMLEMISNFLQGRETANLAEHTHAVFDSYQDWWLNQRPTFRLSIVEDNTLEMLYEYIGTMYDLGVPLTLTEKRTPQIRLIQDVEIWAQKGSEGPLPVPVEEVISPQSAFMQMLREALHEVYPESDFLDVVVFDATGVSRQRSSMKMSLRLVWPNVVVDRERSVAIREFLVQKFETSTHEGLQALGDRLAEQNPDNRWANVFSAAVHTAQHGVRMPLNDRVSPAPMKMPERRPFRPHGVLRFNYADGAEPVELIAQSQDLGSVDWLKIGTIRRDAGTELTQWREPAFQRGPHRGERRAAGGGGGGGGGFGPGSSSLLALQALTHMQVAARGKRAGRAPSATAPLVGDGEGGAGRGGSELTAVQRDVAELRARVDTMSTKLDAILRAVSRAP